MSHMPDDFIQDESKTRHLAKSVGSEAILRRATGPLDKALPWVLEFRVVGTASTIQIRVGEVISIGRSDTNQGVAPEVDLGEHGGHGKGVSRKHAVIITKDDSITIKDLGSTNGTRLNGFKLNPNQPYRLRHGDELTFGQLTVQVLFAVVPLLKEIKKSTQSVIPAVGSGQHILVIEDDTDVAAVFGMILEQAGFRVTTVNTGTAAIGAISHKMPDAIILDLMLPDIDGHDLIELFRREEPPGQHIPLIVVSGVSGGFQMNKALNSGVDAFLSKPVGVDELISAITPFVPQMS